MKRKKRRKIRKSVMVIFLVLLILLLVFVLFGLKKHKPEEKKDTKAETKEVEQPVDKDMELREQKYKECMKQPYKMDTLDEEFNNLFKSYSNLNLGIAFTDVNNDYTYYLNEKKGYYSGCVVKIFSVIYFVEKARAGEIDLNSTLTYKPEDKHQFSDMTDQHNFYDEIPITTLIRYMLTISDNSAYFIIIHNYGADTFNNYFRDKYGIHLTFTNNHPFISNYTAELGNKSLELLYDVLKVDDEYSKLIREAMSNEVENTLNFDDVKFLHKYGEYDVWHNDIGIYDTDNPYLVTILTTAAYGDYKGLISGVNKDMYTIYKKNLESKENYCRSIN